MNISGDNNTALRLLYQLDDEAIPVGENIFHSTPAQGLVEELSIKTNTIIAHRLAVGLPEKALLRRHAQPIQRRMSVFGDRMNRLGFGIDVTNGATLQNSLLRLDSDTVREVRLRKVLVIKLEC